MEKNLLSSSKLKRDPNIPLIEKLSNLSRMPTNRQVLGNYAFLFKDHKGSQERVKIIIADIEMLWNETLDFPIFSRALIRKKLNRLIDMSSKNKKNPT